MMFVSLFLFKQKTAYDRRMSDWGSDVCSSARFLVLFSRTSTSFLAPILAKRIETRIHDGNGASLFIDMQFVLAAASVATLIGILLVPTGQRMFAAAIGWYQNNRSTTKLALKDRKSTRLNSSH